MREKSRFSSFEHIDSRSYWVTQKLPQIYTANHATFPIRIRKITVQICGNFQVTQYNTFCILLHPPPPPLLSSSLPQWTEFLTDQKLSSYQTSKFSSCDLSEGSLASSPSAFILSWSSSSRIQLL